MIKGKRTFVTVGDDLRALWRIVKELGTAITDFFIEPWKALVNSFSTGIDDGGIELSLDNVIRMSGSVHRGCEDDYESSWSVHHHDVRCRARDSRGRV